MNASLFQGNEIEDSRNERIKVASGRVNGWVTAKGDTPAGRTLSVAGGDNQRESVKTISVGVKSYPSLHRYPTFRSVTPPCPSPKSTPVRKVSPLPLGRHYISLTSAIDLRLSR